MQDNQDDNTTHAVRCPAFQDDNAAQAVRCLVFKEDNTAQAALRRAFWDDHKRKAQSDWIAALPTGEMKLGFSASVVGSKSAHLEALTS
eukprot:2823471-Amphidinium_carterae.2